MPELPEVETYAKTFARHALNKRIVSLDVRDERILAVRRETFVKALRGRSFVRVRRHGKHLFADAGAVWLRLHFGMTGDLAAWRGTKEPPRFARLVFDFADGSHLAFEDMRLFGVADLVDDPETFIADRRLGADPLDPSFRLPRFRSLLEGRRGAVKSLLMSQEVIAGIGNLYADEMLFQSGIHPKRPVDRLSPDEVRRLHASLRAILRSAVRRGASDAPDPRSWLIARRAEGERCPRCGGAIRRTVVFGRTTYFCARHQT